MHHLLNGTSPAVAPTHKLEQQSNKRGIQTQHQGEQTPENSKQQNGTSKRYKRKGTVGGEGSEAGEPHGLQIHRKNDAMGSIHFMPQRLRFQAQHLFFRTPLPLSLSLSLLLLHKLTTVGIIK